MSCIFALQARKSSREEELAKVNAKLEELQASMREAQKQSDVIRAKQQQLKREHQEAKVRVRVCEWLCFTEKSQPEPQLVLFIRPIALPPPSTDTHARSHPPASIFVCVCSKRSRGVNARSGVRGTMLRRRSSTSESRSRQAIHTQSRHVHMHTWGERDCVCVRACVCVRCTQFAAFTLRWRRLRLQLVWSESRNRNRS